MTKDFYIVKNVIKNNEKKINLIKKALKKYKMMSQKEIFDFFKKVYI